MRPTVWRRWLQQMTGLDVQVAIDQRGGHVFGKHIQHQDPLVFEVAEHFVAPAQDFGRGGRPIEIPLVRHSRLRRLEELAVAQQHAQRQVAPDCDCRYRFT